MKLLVFTLGGVLLYLILRMILTKLRIKKFITWLAPAVTIFVVVLYLSLALLSSLRGDMQCRTFHKTSSLPPVRLMNANDYFDQGNYDYDIGNCAGAIAKYDRALVINPVYAEAYNNRAYTYMRMGTYDKALPDLNRAIELRPDYIRALMNRGDIYNYYFLIDKQKALSDYDKIIALGAPKEGSLCGHRLLAINNGWSLNVVWQLVTRGMKAGCL